MKHFNLLACSLLTAGVLCIVSVAWAAEVSPQEAEAIIRELQATGGAVQPIGMSNDAYAKYFTGQSYLAELSADKSFAWNSASCFSGCNLVIRVNTWRCTQNYI